MWEALKRRPHMPYNRQGAKADRAKKNRKPALKFRMHKLNNKQREGEKMKRVLWISRHQMTPLQRMDVERALQDAVQLTCWTQTVRDLAQLAPAVRAADAVAAVLPVELLAQLIRLAEGRPVLQAVSERQPTGRMLALPDGRQEAEFAFVHRGWQQIVRLELEVRDLPG